MSPTQITTQAIAVETSPVACDGGGEALGHPRVYLTLGHDGAVECPYCGQRYAAKPGAKLGGHGH